LFEPIVFPDDMPEARPNPMSGPARARRASFPSRAAALERYASRPPLNLMRADALAAYVTYGFADQPDGSVTLKCSPETEASTFECEVKVKTSVIAGITTPITVGVGVDEEGPNPARLGPPTVDVLPNARLERFDRLGHFGPFQDPPAMADAIADHLSWAAQSRT